MADLKASETREETRETRETREETSLPPPRLTRRRHSPRRAPGDPASGHRPLRARARVLLAASTPGALWRNHRLFSFLVVLAIAVRVLATLAFRPALLIPDSFGYLHVGTHLAIEQTRPGGYPILLRVLAPLHSLLAVTTLQHVLGIAAAIIVYGLLRYWGLPAWGASLAAVPTLFDARQIALESYILPDALFGFVILLAVALLLSRRTPTIWPCVLAGLLLAWASVVRGNGAPIMVALAAYLLIRRVGWRAWAASIAAFTVPLAGYVTVFHAAYGQLDITNSTGMFLWSRTMSFANCAVLKPPPDLRPLCPDRQGVPATATPAWSVSSLLAEPTPGDYLWSKTAFWRHDGHPGINADNNELAMRFATRAIAAQPLSYLRVTGQGIMLLFLSTDRPDSYLSLNFTAAPDVAKLTPVHLAHLRGYAHTSSNSHAVQPYAYYLLLYQLPVWFPGMAFFVVLVIGLAGVLRRWRCWGTPGVLPWAVAAIGVVVPIALHEYVYRYAITAVPVACLAAGLAFTRRQVAQRPATAPELDGSGQNRSEAPV